ncbi:GT4 family glycosyltransferase PelF [Priestia abyssalis]|uniref:GT4 family glycosyltransferase PelF n=1 Tax=Priestia abyssalis TaxID=1221450 RepID=UPI0009959885|nr:GT4 family glycosyltransferase PelF [Priestia abyssalis]
MDKLKVLLTTEGTYPFNQGGVSTWCDSLVQKMDEIEYIVYSVMMDPFITQKFSLPIQSDLIKMPLWGTEEPCEHLPAPFSLVYLKKKRTTNKVIRTRFLPLFHELIVHILSVEKNPLELGGVLLELHRFFQEYEYKVSFKSELTWSVFKKLVIEKANEKNFPISQPDVYGLIQSLGWVYRFLNILNTPVPRVHVTHASAAAFCGIPCVLSKLEHKTPFLLTEHGVYLREQYLSLGKRKLSSYLNTFLIRFIHSITTLNYEFADQVSPVCHYNTRWESRFGVPADKVEVIYNGVDKTIFTEAAPQKRENPTVVTVARIDPIKDIVTLMKAAAIVKEKIPHVKFIVYGSVSVPEYYEECMALCDTLQLKETFIFAGHTSNIEQAYHSGDVIALSSISEAFPYSVVEAMMTGKPVVTTDVGGIKEALGETGILIEPGNQAELARGLISLLINENLRAELGEKARKRALSYFTLGRVLEQHFKSYVKLALHSEIKEREKAKTSNRLYTREGKDKLPQACSKKSPDQNERQRLLAQKGYALMELGHVEQAIFHFRSAIEENPASPSVPVYLSEIAGMYDALGRSDQAMNEVERIKALLVLQHVSV